MSAEQNDDVPWLTVDQLDDWKALMALLMALPPALDAQVKRDAGLNLFEYHVLAALSASPDRALLLSELARLAQGSMSRMSHAVSRLERDGWVTRCTADDPAYRSLIRMTPAGMDKLAESAPGHVREARRLVVDLLDPEQLRALGATARTIAIAADPHAAARLERVEPSSDR